MDPNLIFQEKKSIGGKKSTPAENRMKEINLRWYVHCSIVKEIWGQGETLIKTHHNFSFQYMGEPHIMEETIQERDQ